MANRDAEARAFLVASVNSSDKEAGKQEETSHEREQRHLGGGVGSPQPGHLTWKLERSQTGGWCKWMSNGRAQIKSGSEEGNGRFVRPLAGRTSPPRR